MIFFCTASIYVRVAEDRMDLLRAAIIGPKGTPYHDGLFFFDVHIPSSYPSGPPVYSKALACFFIIYNVFSHFIEIFVSDDGVCSWYTTTLEDFGLIQTCITVEKYALACLVPGVGKVVRSGIQLNQPCYRFLSPFKLSF